MTSPVLRVLLPYPGGYLSKNRSHYQTARGGRKLKPEVRAWMDGAALLVNNAAQLQGWEWPEPPLVVRLWGFFKDKRSVPDLHNLWPVMDMLQEVSGINDRDIRLDTKAPTLVQGFPTTMATGGGRYEFEMTGPSLYIEIEEVLN